MVLSMMRSGEAFTSSGMKSMNVNFERVFGESVERIMEREAASSGQQQDVKDSPATKTRFIPYTHTLVSIPLFQTGFTPEIACKISCANSAGTVYSCFLLWLTAMPRAVPCCALSLCLPPTTRPQSPTHKGLERH